MRIDTSHAAQMGSLLLAVLSAFAQQPTGLIGAVGSDKAPVVVLIFSDFESFPCARSADVLNGLLDRTRDVRLIFKHAPSSTNPNSVLAHEAAIAAGAQGKFWEMHDLLFGTRPNSAAPTCSNTPRRWVWTCPPSGRRLITTHTARTSSATWLKPKGSASPPHRRSSSTAGGWSVRRGTHHSAR